MPSTIDNAIVSPATYADPDASDALFRSLRHNDPVRWTTPDGFRPFWTLSRYADIREVEGQAELFINAPRLVLRPIALEQEVRKLTGGRSLLLRNLVNMDGPEHRTYRMLTQGWFAGPRLKALEAEVRALARESVDALGEGPGEREFVQEVAAWFPLKVITRILGLPSEDLPRMLKLTQQIFGPDDPDVREGPGVNVVSTVDEFTDYFTALTAARRARPSDDLASLIANAKIDGNQIGDLEAQSYYILIATAGHDTTSSTIAGGLLALAERPEQYRRLRADRDLLPSAVDEMIRWVTPVKHFFRTAVRDAVVAGVKIAEGQHLLLSYASANRDEAVFEDPYTFSVARNPNRHLAFGYGPHVCLGQHLAKLEIRIFFEELLQRFERLEPAGLPARVRSNFVSGLKRLPLRYA